MKSIFAVPVSVFAIAMATASGARAQTAAETSQATAAEDATSKAKLPASATSGRQNIDEEITNPLLRASTGSKSLFSAQSAFTYNGGSMKSPLSQERPNLMPGSVAETATALKGQVSGKYRLTDHDNLNVGVGVDWVKPTYTGQYGQVDNPYAQYSRLFNAAGMQNVFTATLTKYTSNELNDDGFNWETDVNHTVLANVGKTKLEVGLNVDWSHEFYTTPSNPAKLPVDTLAAYPFAEYAFTDSYSFRTVYRGLNFNNTPNSSTTFARQEPTQSMGLGATITRDIYLYPNIQWVWSDVRPEKTNVALTAYINL
jgi:hypothetical protein